MNSQHARLLDVLRDNGTQAVGLDELRADGIAMPSQVVYELQLAGHDIRRVYEGSRESRKLLGYRLQGVRQLPEPEGAR